MDAIKSSARGLALALIISGFAPAAVAAAAMSCDTVLDAMPWAAAAAAVAGLAWLWGRSA